MTAIVVQARIDSSRLPGKALLLIDGKPLVLRVMEALNQIPCDLKILACPEDSFKDLSPLAEKCGFKIFSGPKEDVLERYCKVIRHFSVKRVIRATADNPFVFADAASSINAEALALKADYSGYSGLPLGAGVESVCANALLRAGVAVASSLEDATAKEASYDREHVCPYLYTHPEIFKLHRPLAPLRWQGSNIRLTVDTREDYDRACELFTSLKNDPFKYYGASIIKKYTEIFL